MIISMANEDQLNKNLFTKANAEFAAVMNSPDLYKNWHPAFITMIRELATASDTQSAVICKLAKENEELKGQIERLRQDLEHTKGSIPHNY